MFYKPWSEQPSSEEGGFPHAHAEARQWEAAPLLAFPRSIASAASNQDQVSANCLYCCHPPTPQVTAQAQMEAAWPAGSCTCATAREQGLGEVAAVWAQLEDALPQHCFSLPSPGMGTSKTLHFGLGLVAPQPGCSPWAICCWPVVQRIPIGPSAGTLLLRDDETSDSYQYSILLCQ